MVKKFHCCNGLMYTFLEVYPEIVGKTEVIQISIGEDSKTATLPTYKAKVKCEVCGKIGLENIYYDLSRLPLKRNPLSNILLNMIRPYLMCSKHPKYIGKEKSDNKCNRCLYVYNEKSR